MMKTLFGNPKRIVLIVVTILIVFSTLVVSDGQAASRIVQLFYFLPKDQTYDARTVNTMKRWIVDAQSFYREQMEAHGHGSMTFDIETDDQGNPIVHRVDGAHDSNHYAKAPRPYELDEIRGKFNTDQIVTLVYSDLTVSTKFGGKGVGIKQAGDAVVYQWRWETVLHELGHGFGLYHDFRDRVHIMAYGDRRNSLSKCAADFLAMCPYFNPDIPLAPAGAPTVLLSNSPDLYEPTFNYDDFHLGVYPYGLESLKLPIQSPRSQWAASGVPIG